MSGKRIYLYPVYANPESKWNCPCIIEKADNKQKFKDRIDCFMAYNGGGEMGNYCKYFIEI